MTETTTQNETATADCAPTGLFGVGDRVTWMHCTSNGKRMGFSTREGVIISTLNKCAFVKQRNNKREWVRFTNLTKAGEKTEVSKLFGAMAADTAKPTPNEKLTESRAGKD